MSKPTAPLPDWESVLSAAAHLQEILPGAVLVGGTAAAIHAGHRLSLDADHVLTDLRSHFDRILAELESVAGWQTNRIARARPDPGKPRRNRNRSAATESANVHWKPWSTITMG